MKKVILLYNNAPDVRMKIRERFYSLIASGSIPIVVAESHFLTSELMPNIEIKYCLEDYINFHNVEKDNNILELNDSLKHLNIWESYYSDYERDIHFGKKVDRTIIERKLILLYNFYFDLFSAELPEVIIYENISNSFAFAAFNVSKFFNIKYVGITTARIPGRIYLHQSIFDDSYSYLNHLNDAIKKTYKINPDERLYLDEYLKNFKFHVPDYMKSNNLGLETSNFRYLKINKLKYLKSALFYDLSRIGREENLQTNDIFKSSIKTFFKNLSRKFKVKILKSFYEAPSSEDKFYLYPLHFHPESSTSVIARSFANELQTIQNISFSLPFGSILYVKDHPSAAGFMSMSFYKKIKALPNVKLISHHISSKELIRNSLAIITLTSTVGFEALLLNKKVFLFGKTFYESHPNCEQIMDISNLFKIFSNLKVNFYNPFDTLYAYYKLTYPKNTKIENLI